MTGRSCRCPLPSRHASSHTCRLMRPAAPQVTRCMATGWAANAPRSIHASGKLRRRNAPALLCPPVSPRRPTLWCWPRDTAPPPARCFPSSCRPLQATRATTSGCTGAKAGAGGLHCCWLLSVVPHHGSEINGCAPASERLCQPVHLAGCPPTKRHLCRTFSSAAALPASPPPTHEHLLPLPQECAAPGPLQLRLHRPERHLPARAHHRAAGRRPGSGGALLSMLGGCSFISHSQLPGLQMPG